MYKDKQREANRQAQAKFKAKGITNRPPSGITIEGITDRVLPERTGVNLEALNIAAVPNDRGGLKLVAPIPKSDTLTGESVAVAIKAIQGASPKQGYIGAVPCAPPILEPKPKRGKDIKCFRDLPPDVQQTIDRISDTTEEHIKRTEAAINYQQAQR